MEAKKKGKQQAAAKAGPPKALKMKKASSSSEPVRWTWRNNPLLNVVLLLAVPLPSIAFMWFLSHSCSDPSALAALPASWRVSLPESVASLLGLGAAGAAEVGPEQVCSWAMEHPLALLNVLFFLNVDVLFWLISLFQGSTWLIDPYWTIIPVLIAHFFAAHPAATFDPLRSFLSLGLVWLWSIRLTHSYFRREEWELGAREDWRFTDMRKRYGAALWAVLSFPIAYLSQHVLLVGICLPFYSIHFPALSPLPASAAPADLLGLRDLVASSAANATATAASAAAALPPSPPFDGVWDPLIAGLCLAGIVVAYFADTQLCAFMHANEQRARQGKPKVLILNSGLWYYSRHPNYFGEQLWWWALSLFSVYVGQWYMVAGTLINSLCLATVTLMVEQRMLERPERKQAFLEYQRTTSVLVPWFKGSATTASTTKKRN
ncbi:uncharacterized protein ACA1_061710 [Acanthamoeba castellanii str. Neff]|uniref:Steroid 5-alpha reductase C-terminal domain-containing protein n=1 Tax=Acanthamoeba castellanii (strain ATCC 30010 / Neff) TaxID=1257118 RepID=L8GZ98_ACACF|nr:uncharacterized protein ACA1_061710 [Acanthamoeba castellanii str. Neff]ELR17431.1 hypothetical protein ACA1_061710 [Acanthamoeba castellanii str. Neff]